MLIVYCLKVEDAERFLTSAERQAVLLHLLYSLKGSGQPPVLNKYLEQTAYVEQAASGPKKYLEQTASGSNYLEYTASVDQAASGLY